ncbi:TPA: hypothetical protein VNU18_001049 [Streptococcus pyogenes]|nr:hypothetical protein [Streptococcus pyogenes]HES9302354.1 hypothetical protein [Streptococcus pyogenes]
MKQQSYQPLRFVYLLVALFAALLLIARPVMADEENDPWILGYKQGLKIANRLKSQKPRC